MSTISNAADRPLFAISGTVPDVSGALQDYYQQMTFTNVSKGVGPTFEVIETPTTTTFLGVWQPFSARQLMMKPEGQRSWKWFMLHSQPILSLDPDDVVIYQGTQYRVMGQTDYSLYGYMQYELKEDYTGSGP